MNKIKDPFKFTIIVIGIFFITLIIRQLIIVLWNALGLLGTIIFGVPILLAIIATYEFYKQNNQKLDWGEISPYFAGAFLLMAAFELFVISLFFNDVYTTIVKSLPDWNFLIAIIGLSLAIILGYGRKASTKKEMETIQNELREIKSYMENKKDENMTEETTEKPKKKKI